METLIKEFFEHRISSCRMSQTRLKEEYRHDEEIFEKIKENVYDIFRTIYASATEKYGADSKEAREFFTDCLTRIPANWTSAYEKAAQHQDTEKMHIERIKLDTVSDIREAVLILWRKKI